jgi:hypothetical protein
MNGQELINWIIENDMQNAKVSVTALLQYDGDHDCPETDEFDLHKMSKDSFTLYVGGNLQD